MKPYEHALRGERIGRTEVPHLCASINEGWEHARSASRKVKIPRRTLIGCRPVPIVSNWSSLDRNCALTDSSDASFVFSPLVRGAFYCRRFKSSQVIAATPVRVRTTVPPSGRRFGLMQITREAIWGGANALIRCDQNHPPPFRRPRGSDEPFGSFLRKVLP